MFTMAKIRNGATYLGNHLSANDYYAEGEKVRGEWIGQGARMLGLRGEVMSDQFEALRCNERPNSNERLTPRKRLDRVAFFDFQCSAQKSVSLMAMLGGDARLRIAHDEAAKTAFGELERFAARQQNTRTLRQSAITGNLSAAAFVHDASRALDPQLHTHFVVVNATRDACGQWVALNEFEMVRAIRYVGKVYQNELARAVMALGYGIRETRDAKGRVTGFEIDGVADELCRRFAKRRAEIEREIRRFQDERGREPTASEIGQITRQTRSAKLSAISTPAVRDRQLSQLSEDERRELIALRERAIANPTSVKPCGREGEALQVSVAHLFERQSVAKVHEILAEALNQNLGAIDLDRLKQSLSDDQPEVIHLTSGPALLAECATKHGLELERWSVAFVNATREGCAPLNPAFVPNGNLSDEQSAAVCAILSSRDQVFSFRGVAGAGKTTSLQELHRGLTEAGHRALYIAPTAAAARVLQAEDFSRATTVEDFLQNVVRRESLRGAVVICDEAGLKSNRQGATLLRLAQERGMRVLFVGDVRQHVSVEAGDFLRVLETYSQLGRCEIADIRRQQAVPAYKAAVELMAAGDAKGGLNALDELGWVHGTGADYLQRAAEDYLRLSCEGSELDRCLAVAPTWAENHRLTDAVRSGLKARGKLAEEGMAFTVHDSLQWTIQQKRNARNYRPAQVVLFTRPTGVWKAGDSAEVRNVSADGHISVVTMDGAERRLPLRAAASFDVGRVRSLEIASGDKLLVRANEKRLALINGQVLTVERIEADRTIVTREGMCIPAAFRQWCHGYVVTSHKAQGRSCVHVVVAAERLDAKATYVACSRGRLSCTLHTPDKRRLQERLPEGGRQAALDVMANTDKGSVRTVPLPAIAARVHAWMRLLPTTAIQKARQAKIQLRRQLEQIRQRVRLWQKYRTGRQSHRVASKREQSPVRIRAI